MGSSDGIAFLDKARARLRDQDQERDPTQPEFSDVALAAEFSRRHGDDLRGVAAWGEWLTWDGERWPKVGLRVLTWCAPSAAMRLWTRKPPNGDQATHAPTDRQRKTVAAVEKLARSDPKRATLPEAFDADLMLFNTPGGTVDLRTGDLQEHCREDLLTECAGASADHDADDSVWLRFWRSDLPESGPRGLLRRFQAIASPGTWRADFGFIVWARCQRRELVLDMMLYILGDYAKAISSETLMRARGERHPTDVRIC